MDAEPEFDVTTIAEMGINGKKPKLHLEDMVYRAVGKELGKVHDTVFLQIYLPFEEMDRLQTSEEAGGLIPACGTGS